MRLVGQSFATDSTKTSYLRYEDGQKIKPCSLDGTLTNKAGFMTGEMLRGEVNRARKCDRGEIETLKRKRHNALNALDKLGASGYDDCRNASEIMKHIEKHKSWHGRDGKHQEWLHCCCCKL